jgi:transcriptional regulator with XRE-family HTH domain
MARRQRLVERREALGLSQEQVARAVGRDVGTYRNYESGRSTPRPGDRRPLADALEWTVAQLAYALNSDDAPPPNGQQVVPEWLTLYANLEQTAASIRTWAPWSVHALLQTADYATAVESVGPVPSTDQAIAQRVELRLSRQAVLDRRPNPLELAVVLDESVLHRVTGGSDVMAAQLDHLADVAERPNVDLRVLPLDAGVHAAAFGTFTLLSAPGSPEPFMASVEDRTGHRYLEGQYAVEAHRLLFDHLRDFALSPGDSLDTITATAKEYR